MRRKVPVLAVAAILLFHQGADAVPWKSRKAVHAPSPVRPEFVSTAPSVALGDPFTVDAGRIFREPVRVSMGELPECVHRDSAALRFPGSYEPTGLFYSKLKKVLDNGKGNINIWHVGGSHVQAGYFPGRMMLNFNRIAPGMQGERGFVFPYRMLKTNYDYSYRMAWSGEWDGYLATKKYKNMRETSFGATGVTATTFQDSAAVSLSMHPYKGMDWNFNSLRVMGYSSSDSVYPYLISGTDTVKFKADAVNGGYLADLDDYRDSVSVFFRVPEGESFTLTGLQPVSGRSGINYYSSGVNGATLTTWLDKCTDLQRDLGIVSPDLAILAVGINDSAGPPNRFYPEVFKSRYRRLIMKVKEVAPDCAFMFITNNDSYRYQGRRMTYNLNAEAVQKAMYELAEEFDAAVWDVYEIMGGAKSVDAWRDAGLIGSDRLHFTKEGYELLGDMLFNAIVKDYQSWISQQL